MSLVTDFIEPEELTGFVRTAAETYDQDNATLARWLPNKHVSDILVKYVVGGEGRPQEAEFRAYGAEGKIGSEAPLETRTAELIPATIAYTLDEYTRLRGRNADAEEVKTYIFGQAEKAVRGILDRVERLRGDALVNGGVRIDQPGFKLSHDYGRAKELAPTVTKKWDAAKDAGDPLADLQAWVDTYVEINGTMPGTLLMSQRVMRALAASPKLSTTVGATKKPATYSELLGYLSAEGFNHVEVYGRRTAKGLVVSDDTLLFLPAPSSSEDWAGQQLGATLWGPTAAALEPAYGLSADKRAGVTAGVYKGGRANEPVEVVADATVLPVLANPNLALVAKVLTPKG